MTAVTTNNVNPEDVLRRKREQDMIFRGIKRYTQKSTNSAINSSMESTVKKTRDDDGYGEFRREVLKSLNLESIAIKEL